MVKNFSQMAYVNDPEKGLELFPHVKKTSSSLKLNCQSDESDEEGKKNKGPVDDELTAKKGKMARLFMNKKPETNDGDIENFYSADPSKFYPRLTPN